LPVGDGIFASSENGEFHNPSERIAMAWGVVVFFLLLWVVGLIEARVVGAFAHLFLVLAVISGIYLLVRRNRAN
jgi:hypothetical protein